MLFAQYQNILSPNVMQQLQENYLGDDIHWKHRGFGRFFRYLTEEEHNLVLDDLYSSDPNNPLFGDKWLMRNQHMYMQKFIPESWLPMHREKCYGVVTIYVNPDSDWADQPQPKFVYYDTTDLKLLDDYKHTFPIHFNSGTYSITPEHKTPEFTAYHKVEYNKSDVDRVCLQIFYGPGGKGQIYRNNEAKFDNYADEKKDYTERSLMSGSLDVPGFMEMSDVSKQFNEDHAEIISRLEGNTV